MRRGFECRVVNLCNTNRRVYARSHVFRTQRGNVRTQRSNVMTILNLLNPHVVDCNSMHYPILIVDSLNKVSVNLQAASIWIKFTKTRGIYGL